MNTARRHGDADASRTRRRIQDPEDHLFRRYSSEMVAYADLVLPDTTYLERHDCISLLDRPICEAEAAADAIRWPVVDPATQATGATSRFQSVLIDLGARLRLPGSSSTMTARRSIATTPITSSITSAAPASARWRVGAATATEHGRGAPNPEQLRALYREWRLLDRAISRTRRVFQTLQCRLSGLGGEDGPFRQARSPIDLPALCRADAQVPARRAKGMASASRPSICATRSRQPSIRLPIWYQPFEQAGRSAPSSRCTPSPSARRRCIILGQPERLAAPDPRAQSALRARRGLRCSRAEDGDWAHVYLASRAHHGAGGADGRAEPADGLDLERHRQAQGRLGAGRRRAGGEEGLSAEPPDPRVAAAQGRRPALVEFRSRSPARRRGTICV